MTTRPVHHHHTPKSSIEPLTRHPPAVVLPLFSLSLSHLDAESLILLCSTRRLDSISGSLKILDPPLATPLSAHRLRRSSIGEGPVQLLSSNKKGENEIQVIDLIP
ncbi:hypothetical protein P8452_70044 [Trifolium repens]|nr:hypothetical protein P8452_70044 [Trifolium repens]